MHDPLRTDGLDDRDLATSYPILRAYARRIVRNAADADDVVQDALERAWRSRDRLRPGASARPWLAAITRRAALDVVRVERTSVAFDETRAGERGESAESAASRRERTRALDVAIATLAVPYREVLVLHDVLGYTSREIAARSSVPYHTVRTRVARARLALRPVARGIAA